jgi:uncharacterized protein YrrD
MITNAKLLNTFTIDSRDGDIGHVKDFYFDDRYWAIRYLIVDTGTWLMDRQVLISPYALGSINVDVKKITVDLTKKQIEDSPSLETAKPVSRQFENDYYGYYGWPVYYGLPMMWSPYQYLERNPEKWVRPTSEGKTWDPHLRSVQAVNGYHIRATDGDIGHVVDFLIDDESWAIRYLVVTTRNWLPGKHLLIAIDWIDRISWHDSLVHVSLSRDAIRRSPEYLGTSLPSSAYEQALHAHYGRSGYWTTSGTKEIGASSKQ